MRKTEWKSCYIGEEQGTIIPVKPMTIEEISMGVNLFSKTLNHKWRMAVQKIRRKLHLNRNHSRKSFRRNYEKKL